MSKLSPQDVEGQGALAGGRRRLQADMAGNRDFRGHRRNTKTLFDDLTGKNAGSRLSVDSIVVAAAWRPGDTG